MCSYAANLSFVSAFITTVSMERKGKGSKLGNVLRDRENTQGGMGYTGALFGGGILPEVLPTRSGLVCMHRLFVFYF